MLVLNELTDLLTYDDLPDGMKFVSEKSGMDFTKLLMLNHPGQKIYVPHPKYIRPLVKRFLKDRVKCASYRELVSLSDELNVSIEYLYVLIKEMYRHKNRPYHVDLYKENRLTLDNLFNSIEKLDNV